MDYKEKVRVAEQAITEVESGVSMEEIKERLTGEGYSSEDVFVIARSIKKQLQNKYEDEIQEMITSGKGEAVSDKFSHLPANEVEEMVKNTRERVAKIWLKKVREKRNQGTTSDELSAMLAQSPLDDAEKLMLLVKLKNEAEDGGGVEGGSVNIVQVGLGIALIIGGILLSMNTTSIFYGAVVVGVIYLFKGLIPG